MKFGFLKVGAFTPSIKVLDVEHNLKEVLSAIDVAEREGVEMLVFPELTLIGVTAGDGAKDLCILNASKKAVNVVKEKSENLEMIIFLGFPYFDGKKVYNACAVINKGKILAITVKNGFSLASETGGDRCFSRFFGTIDVDFLGEKTIFGSNVIFREKNSLTTAIGVEIGEEYSLLYSPSLSHARCGATVIAHLSGETATKDTPDLTKMLIKANSLKTSTAYVSSGAGANESTTDYVCSGFSFISENGEELKESGLFACGLISYDIDTEYLALNRLNKEDREPLKEYREVEFSANKSLEFYSRRFDKTPFVPKSDAKVYFNRIADIQAQGLIKRFTHVNARKIIVGLSGGLDSTLALLSTVRAVEKMKGNLKDVIAVTMPCFGTTSRTYLNSIKMAKALSVTLKKIDISKSVLRHLKDIKHEKGVFDACFENAQARERTQVLLDIANKENGLVIGTGDLSEVALGWSTYNGDHMSNYALNGSLSKTLVRFMVENYALSAKPKLKEVLLDILSTPVSPELLPPSEDEIVQKTEELVGPYVLHDYFIYHKTMRKESPEKILFTAKTSFEGEFSEDVIKGWLKRFYTRFYSQQFKRSCMPDGVRAGDVSLSPRGALSLPSDASFNAFIKELE